MKKLKTKESIYLAMRSGIVTFVILMACLIAVLFMGKSYSVMEKTAYGRDVSFLDMPAKDVYMFFGKEYRIPIISAAEKVSAFVKLYAPGIIKLLNYMVTVIKESWQSIIKML